MEDKELLNKIKDRKLKLTIIGSGYVGLPTAALFAEAGFNVTAVDLKPEIIESVNNGLTPIDEPGLQELISSNVKTGRLKAVLNSDKHLKQKDVVIVTVQTPINKDKKPDLTFLLKAVTTIGKNLRKDTIVTICSTIPPKTTQEKIKPLLESLSGLKADVDFYLAYVPERIAPGKTLKEFTESTRLVGGIGKNSANFVSHLFSTVCKKIVETDALTAEIAKVAENTFRDVNIAFANELALICEQNGADVTEVISLANTHPRVNIHLSGPGVGGPCLTKDPYLLIDQIDCKNNSIITTARCINDSMPNHIIDLTKSALQYTKKDVETAKIAVLGTAYKADVDDSRNSASEKTIQGLLALGFKVFSYDPFCSETFGAKKASSLQEVVHEADCLIILTDHSEFKKIDLSKIKPLMNNNPSIVDGKRIITPHVAEEKGFSYFGVGYPALTV